MKKRFYPIDESTEIASVASHMDVWWDVDDLHSLEDMVMPGAICAGKTHTEILRGMYADATEKYTWDALYIDADYYDSAFGPEWPVIVEVTDDNDDSSEYWAACEVYDKISEAYQIFEEYF